MLGARFKTKSTGELCVAAVGEISFLGRRIFRETKDGPLLFAVGSSFENKLLGHEWVKHLKPTTVPPNICYLQDLPDVDRAKLLTEEAAQRYRSL